uniref:Uncharacterized protein n=1 Tax=viral metagenome TaxID=1070528 RepID=A0A6C0JRV7_9ZZZZ
MLVEIEYRLDIDDYAANAPQGGFQSTEYRKEIVDISFSDDELDQNHMFICLDRFEYLNRYGDCIDYTVVSAKLLDKEACTKYYDDKLVSLDKNLKQIEKTLHDTTQIYVKQINNINEEIRTINEKKQQL